MSKFKVFKISESHEFKFKISESDEFKISNFNFYKKNTTPRTVWAFQGVDISQTNAHHNLYEVTIGFGWTVFSETDVGGTKISKERGRGGSSMEMSGVDWDW